MTTDLHDKTVADLHCLFSATSHDASTSMIYQEVARRLEEAQRGSDGYKQIAAYTEGLLKEAQQKIESHEPIHKLLIRLMARIWANVDMSLPDASDVEVQLMRQLATPARDAEVAAKALEECADEWSKLNRLYSAYDIAASLREEAAEYRAKAGRKE